MKSYLNPEFIMIVMNEDDVIRTSRGGNATETTTSAATETETAAPSLNPTVGGGNDIGFGG